MPAIIFVMEEAMVLLITGNTVHGCFVAMGLVPVGSSGGHPGPPGTQAAHIPDLHRTQDSGSRRQFGRAG